MNIDEMAEVITDVQRNTHDLRKVIRTAGDDGTLKLALGAVDSLAVQVAELAGIVRELLVDYPKG